MTEMFDTNSTAWVRHIAETIQARRRSTGDIIEQFFSSPVPEDLWHYTTVAGYSGILSSASVWATEVRHTKDTSEFIHARDIVTGYLDQWRPDGDDERFAKEVGYRLAEEEFAKGILSERSTEVFIASFSSKEDRKSQWEEFADKGRGVSICFDMRSVRPPEELRVAVTLAPCIYLRGDAEKLLQIALKHFLDMALKSHRDSGSVDWLQQQLNDWLLVDRVFGLQFNQKAFQHSKTKQLEHQLQVAQTLTRFDLLRLAAHCKNPYFSEEHEWRLALPHTKGTPLRHEIRFRGDNHDIPYIAHNLFSERRLPIRKIMLGPSCTEGERIQEELTAHGYEVPVFRSKGTVRAGGPPTS